MASARTEMLSDLYLCSSNAITLDGLLVNVDGMENRVSAMTFGPKKVIVPGLLVILMGYQTRV